MTLEMLLLLQKMAFWEGWKYPKKLKSQKMRFFKVWDNDTTIQPGEKEGQTDVSSALKKFYDHYRCFWENLIFWFFELCISGSVQKAQ